jgi:hypothetical protein
MRRKQEILKEKRKALIAVLFCLGCVCRLEQVPDGFLSRLLSQNFRGYKGQGFFWAPFDALWFTLCLVGAAVACKHDFFVWVHVHCAELARGDAPSAAVAC